MSRLIVGPFNRVEGDLEVRLDIDGDRVRDARVVSPLYRGFEGMMTGKAPADALVYAPRICGICSVSQSVAAAAAIADASGIVMPPNGRHAINIIHAVENIADHLTHFYLFFMPDFTNPTYGSEPWHADAVERFAAIKGSASADFLPARAAWMQLLGILAGKWPHTLSIQPGGSTRAVDRGEIARLSGMIMAFRRFVERVVIGDRLENLAAIDSVAALEDWADARPRGDFGIFLSIARAISLRRLGRAAGRFLSFGAYPAPDGGHAFARGLVEAGVPRPVPIDRIAEDVSHAWYGAEGDGQPGDTLTRPDLSNEAAYSWCKAPRLDGRPVEVGALARQLVDRQPLIVDYLAQRGGNAEGRVIARILETARTVIAMEQWLTAIAPDEPFIDRTSRRHDGNGAGLTEAARGSLGHWMRIENGRVAGYQIIAPTTWNFSPRDAKGNPGPLEMALRDAPIRPGEKEPVSVQHIVRSFDPCMVCTAH